MEKRKLSGKTILKLVGALLALTYLGFYFYVGITGKLPYMHETVHIMRYGERKKWVAGGMTAAMILGICINSALNDLNLKRIRKESFLPLFFTMIFPIILLLLLEAFLDNGWLGIGIYASVAIFMCATAWIPLILRKWITHLLLRDKPKINAYVAFIESEQYDEIYPNADFKMAMIEIHFKYDITDNCQKFLQVVQDQLGRIGIKIKAQIS